MDPRAHDPIPEPLAAPTQTGAVLLAAGAGTRFAGSTHKLLAEIDGVTVVERALAAMVDSGCERIAIVTGSVALAGRIPTGVVELPNPDWAAGQATSLIRAVEWAITEDLDALVVGLGDQPGVPASAWRAVAGACQTPAAVATYGGRRGHPVRLARPLWDLLPRQGDRGAGPVLAGSPELVTEVACDGDATDVDRVEDLTRWRRR